MKEYDYILVGQGIAGTVLADKLIQKKKKVFVFDQFSQTSSSRVAAGIFNPVTGKRMLLTWKAHQLFPELFRYYQDFEQRLGINFFHPMPIYKPFSSVQEQNHWVAETSGSYGDYIDLDLKGEKFKGLIENENGGFETKKSGYVDLPVMLNAFREKLKDMSLFSDETFHYNRLDVKESYVVYDEKIKSKKLIFTEGKQSMNNPFFNWLPFVPAKGEILTIETDQNQITSILNKSVFILKGKDGNCKVGSTYEWDFKDDNPSEAGKNELLRRLNSFFKLPYKIIDQTAGIRPASRDRRPFLGLHPHFKTLGVFNGLGTKGVSLAPFFASQMVDLLESGIEPDRDVNINRLLALYFSNSK